MTNHVHLLASAKRPYALSLMMQYVGRYFVRYINHVYWLSGTLWEGRFRSSLVDTETYFLRCCRYIECNPVRAQMVRGPGEYRWSSYRHHAFGELDKLLVAHEQYERLGGSDTERQSAYRDLSTLNSILRSLLKSELPPTTDGRSAAIDSRTR